MNLVEEYLRAVALLLPKAQREDITAELRDIVLSRIEAREAELGRRLSDDETEAVLREVGHPLAVAAGYREGPGHVVGPTLYPYWAFAVRVALTLQGAIALLIFVARTAGSGNPGRAFGQALSSAITGSLVLIGVATLVAWLTERRLVKIAYLDRWRVRDLRGLEFASWDWETVGEHLSAAGATARAGRARWGGSSGTVGRGIGGIAGAVLFALWWVGVLHPVVARDPLELRALGLDLGALEGVDWAGLKAAVFWPVLAYCLAVIAQGVVILLRPRAVRVQGAFDVAIGAGVLGLAAWIWCASPLAAAIQVGSVAEFARRLRDSFGHGAPILLAPLLTLGVVFTAFGAVCRTVRGLWLLVVGAGVAAEPAFGAQPTLAR